MPHTVIEGKAMITVILDGGSGDYITPKFFMVENIYWRNVNATDVLIIREYDETKDKSQMPYIPWTNLTNTQLVGMLPPSVCVQYVIDYAASTTLTGNVVTFIGRWGG